MESLNIWQRLAGIREIASVVGKDKSSYSYKYASFQAILAKVQAGMKKFGVSITPSIVPGTVTVTPQSSTKRKFDKVTKESYDEASMNYLVTAQLDMRITNNDDPSDFINMPWYLTGSNQDPSQALGSGLSYCSKYFLIRLFNISTPEDDAVEDWRKAKEEAEHADEQEEVKAIVAKIDAVIHQQELDDEKRKALTTMLKKLIVVDGKPSANYMAIKSAAVAHSVYAGVSNLLGTKEEI